MDGTDRGTWGAALLGAALCAADAIALGRWGALAAALAWVAVAIAAFAASPRAAAADDDGIRLLDADPAMPATIGWGGAMLGLAGGLLGEVVVADGAPPLVRAGLAGLAAGFAIAGLAIVAWRRSVDVDPRRREVVVTLGRPRALRTRRIPFEDFDRLALVATDGGASLEARGPGVKLALIRCHDSATAEEIGRSIATRTGWRLITT
jgi:hypothetical protein